MSGVVIVEVRDADDGMRLDRWFRQHYPHVRHGDLEKMLRKGQIRVDGGRVKSNRRLATGETVRVPPVGTPEQAEKAESSEADKKYIRSLVIYEDDALIAINKPFGIAVQGGAKTRRHIDGMLDGLQQPGGERPRLVHRLDRDTGGLLLLGKTRKAASRLSEFFQKHQVDKEYWALCWKMPHPMEGQIDMPIAKKMVRILQEDQERVIPVDEDDNDAKRALTDYQVVGEAGGKVSFVALRPLTGRTHQLRVHTAAIGHPIIGDGKYGGEKTKIEGISAKMHLFCRAMSFPHPKTGKRTILRADLTGHMDKTWTFFGFERKPEIIWPHNK